MGLQKSIGCALIGALPISGGDKRILATDDREIDVE